MNTKTEVLEQLRASTQETPYVVQEQPYGFDMTIDVVDAQWYTLIRKNGLERVFTYEVRLDEAEHTYSITDVSHTVAWDAGADVDGPPTLHREQTTERGRVMSKEFRFETGVDAKTGELGAPVNYTFSSGEGRKLIREVLKGGGWSEQMGAEQKIGLWVAGLTVAALLLVGLVWLVLAIVG